MLHASHLLLVTCHFALFTLGSHFFGLLVGFYIIAAFGKGLFHEQFAALLDVDLGHGLEAGVFAQLTLDLQLLLLVRHKDLLF